jgi:serine/threonine protein kinase
MQIYNLLNTNTTQYSIDKHPSNNIQPVQLVNLLNSVLQEHDKQEKNKDNDLTIFSNPVYLGMGINGDLFKVRDDSSGSEYICKVISYNQAYLKQLKRELGLIKTIQSHPIIREYINPCTKLFIRDNSIISLFPVFNGITLTNVITLLNGSDFNSANRLLLVKYIIKEILEAVYFFHKLNVSHMQLNTESILIELREPGASNLSRNAYKSKYNNSLNNENIPISQKDKFIPTNMEIYDPELTEDDKPLQIKFTNFGIGCGKITEYDIARGRDLNSNKFQQCNIVTFDNDPYLKTYMKALHIQPENMSNTQNSKQLSVAKMYDIWLIGLIILQLILKAPVYAQLMTNGSNGNIIASGISRISDSDLIDESLALYLNVLKKYVLCPIDKRRNLKFVQEMIMLGEKHD